MNARRNGAQKILFLYFKKIYFNIKLKRVIFKKKLKVLNYSLKFENIFIPFIQSTVYNTTKSEDVRTCFNWIINYSIKHVDTFSPRIIKFNE